MSIPKKNTEGEKKVIEFSTISAEKSLELNDLLEVIVDTLNGMGTTPPPNPKKKSA